MVSSRWNSLAALVLASTGLVGFSAVAEDETTPTGQPIEIVARVAAQDGKPVPVEFVIDEPRFDFVAEGAEEASPYWIGVQLEPPTDILKQHLNLAGGMVAVHVYEDSPAAKAGLKANDIILKAADIYIKEPGDLLKSVGKAQESELTLVLLRGGRETTLKVVPAKRPQEGNPQAFKVAEIEEKEAVQKLEAALNLYRKKAAGARETLAVDVLRLWPGVVAGPEVVLDLPKGVAVTITKEGANPAKIVVKKDGKEYAATEDKLNQLPEELRGYLRLPGALIIKGNPAAAPLGATQSFTPTGVYSYHVLPEAKHAAGEVESKLDRILKIVSQKEDSSVSELRKEVQQLRKELEELRQEKK